MVNCQTPAQEVAVNIQLPIHKMPLELFRLENHFLLLKYFSNIYTRCVRWKLILLLLLLPTVFVCGCEGRKLCDEKVLILFKIIF
jgi:hypothetical protein